MRYSEALEVALANLALSAVDGPAVALARGYAAELDAGISLEKLGPKFLSALVELKLTPRARSAVVQDGDHDTPLTSPIDELRRRRTRRASALDATAP